MSFQNLDQEAVYCSPYRSDLLEHGGAVCFLFECLFQRLDLPFDPSNARSQSFFAGDGMWHRSLVLNAIVLEEETVAGSGLATGVA